MAFIQRNSSFSFIGQPATRCPQHPIALPTAAAVAAHARTHSADASQPPAEHAASQTQLGVALQQEQQEQQCACKQACSGQQAWACWAPAGACAAKPSWVPRHRRCSPRSRCNTWQMACAVAASGVAGGGHRCGMLRGQRRSARARFLCSANASRLGRCS
jgi:hypothetical protein